MSTAPPDRVMEGWMSLRDVLADAQRRLAAAGVPSPESDAMQLAAHVMGVPRGRLFLQDRMPPEQRTEFERLLSRRIARVPLQHLLGTAPFRHLELQVGPGVFVPRPETELLAGHAIAFLKAREEGDRIAVDLCCGSGAVALSLATEVSNVQAWAVEVDEAAFRWLERNIEAQGEALTDCASTLVAVHGDATSCAAEGGPLAGKCGQVSVVTANPPYVPLGARPREPEARDHDPSLALYGGLDGLDVVRGILVTARRLLTPGGLLIIEHSDEQGDAAGTAGVPGLLRADDAWQDVRDHLDWNRKPRFTTATRTA